MKISKQELIEMNACRDGILRFIEQTGNTDEPVDVASLVGGLNTYADLLRIANKKLQNERIVRFACDCALINIEKIKPYTDKYDLIVSFLKDPNDDIKSQLDAARAATYAAYAADAAYYAVRAADAARSAVIYESVCSSYAAAAIAAAAANASVVYAAQTAQVAACAGNKDAVDNLLKDLFSQAAKE